MFNLQLDLPWADANATGNMTGVRRLAASNETSTRGTAAYLAALNMTPSRLLYGTMFSFAMLVVVGVMLHYLVLVFIFASQCCHKNKDQDKHKGSTGKLPTEARISSMVPPPRPRITLKL